MQLHELLDKAYHYHHYLLILVCYLISKIKLRGHLAQKYLEMIYFSFHRSLNEKKSHGQSIKNSRKRDARIYFITTQRM